MFGRSLVAVTLTAWLWACGAWAAGENLDDLRAGLQSPQAEVRAQAAQALGRMGEAAKPAAADLMKLVGDSDPAVRRTAVQALAHIRPGPAVALPLLIKLLEDKDPAVRVRAMDALAEMGSEAVERLTAALENEQTAYWACLVVGEIGPKAEAAVPALCKLLNSPQPDVREEAVLALAAIGPGAAKAAGPLTKILDDKPLAIVATYALGRIGKAPPQALAKIQQGAEDADPFRKTISIWALARFRPNDKTLLRDATTRLVAALASDDAAVREAAVRALTDLSPEPEILQPLLVEFFENTDPEKVAAAMKTAARYGKLDVSRLTLALKHPTLRAHAAYLLGEQGPKAEPAVGALLDVLKDPNPEARREAALALAKIGPGAKPAVAELARLAPQPETPAAYAACFALGRIGPGAAEAKPALLKALDSGDETLALFAAWALAHVDPANEQAAPKLVPVLVRGLSEDDPRFRQQAAAALKNLGRLAKPALPALQTAAKDENEQVRSAAQEAIQAIGR